jgi:arylsulfatase A-like enzyme
MDLQRMCFHMEADHPKSGMKAHLVGSRISPIWALTGVALPMTFAIQVPPALNYLTGWELIPLYATEWLIFALASLAVVLGVFGLGQAAIRLRLPVTPSHFATAAFAAVVAIAFVYSARAWVASFNGWTLPQNFWRSILFCVPVVAGVVAARGAARSLLHRLAYVARWFAFAGSFTLLSLPWTVTAPTLAPAREPMKQDAARPNIVLISIDTLAASHLTMYGAQLPTSPRIAEFASHAIVFDQFYANANFTTPGVASILTGLPPWTHRALQPAAHARIDSTVNSLPARLHAAAYTTAYFGSNPWAGGRRQGFSAYFDHEEPGLDWTFGPCIDALANWIPYLCPVAMNPMVSSVYGRVLLIASMLGFYENVRHSDPSRIALSIETWLANRPRAPVFLWVHLFSPHSPYAAPKPWIGRFDPSPAARSFSDSEGETWFAFAQESPGRIKHLSARYDESIAYTDDAVGKLLATVRAQLGSNTAFLITADHGESFSHGYGSHGGVMLYEDLLHIPLIVRLPGETETRERRSGLASQIDLAPTIAALAGIAPSPSWAGRSLLTLLPDNTGNTVFAMNFEENSRLGRLKTGSVAVLEGPWKLVRFLGNPEYPFMPQLKTQLYDLAADPDELHNLATARLDLVGSLSAKIDEELALHGQPMAE